MEMTKFEATQGDLRWNVDPFYLDKSRWQIGLYYEKPQTEAIHCDASKITALTLGDVFSVSSAVTVTADSVAVQNFTDAFQRARKKGFDYFCIIDTYETERDITISCNMYSLLFPVLRNLYIRSLWENTSTVSLTRRI